jgi:hypothetical protein
MADSFMTKSKGAGRGGRRKAAGCLRARQRAKTRTSLRGSLRRRGLVRSPTSHSPTEHLLMSALHEKTGTKSAKTNKGGFLLITTLTEMIVLRVLGEENFKHPESNCSQIICVRSVPCRCVTSNRSGPDGCADDAARRASQIAPSRACR